GRRRTASATPWRPRRRERRAGRELGPDAAVLAGADGDHRRSRRAHRLTVPQRGRRPLHARDEHRGLHHARAVLPGRTAGGGLRDRRHGAGREGPHGPAPGHPVPAHAPDMLEEAETVTLLDTWLVPFARVMGASRR